MMAQLLFGSNTNKLRFIYLVIFSLFLFSCSKKERCYRIEGKEIINGEFYFLLDNNMDYQTSDNTLSSGVPDPYGTGKVDEETYNSISVGDRYCL